LRRLRGRHSVRILTLIAACCATSVLAFHQDGVTTAPAEAIYVSTVSPERADTDVAEQTAELLTRVDESLRRRGSAVGEAVHAQITVADPGDIAAVDRAFAARYKGIDPPARTVLVGVPAHGARLAMQVVAVRTGTPRRAIRPSGWADAPAQSHAILAGDTLYLSGMVAKDPRTDVPVPGDVPAQVRAIMDNAGVLLRAAGMAYDNVASGRVWVRDMSTFAAMNEAYRGYWELDRPTRATIQASLPPFDVGITLVAVAGRREVVVPANADGTPGTIGPNFSPAIRVGRRLFVSGNTGGTPSNRGDVAGQSHEALAKIGRALTAGGFTFEDVVFAETWLTDVTRLPAVNQVYTPLFAGATPPAHSIVGIPSLAGRTALVEIAVLASK
ncbi:MAG: Rid family hydrolase, partial [Vicinamibacterales bacterium]